MDFALNEEQLELQEMVREFVEKEITPYAAEMDAENHMRDGLIDKANEMGLLNVIVPEELDGPGLDSISVATIYEELGKGCAGVATCCQQPGNCTCSAGRHRRTKENVLRYPEQRRSGCFRSDRTRCRQ